MSTTVVEFENQDVIVVEMSGRGPMGPRGRQGEPGPAGPSEWGVIQGNISDQTDLQNALDAKANVGVSYTKAEDDALLAQKADADSVYTKTETDALLSDKADTDDVYSKTEVNTLLSGKADSDTVYTKTETDALLDAKADVGDSYTKAEEDALLAVKANSADVYTKTETDTLLADKADADDVYTKDDVDDALADKADSDDVYTKDEMDDMLLGKAPVILSNASGSIASFSDGSASPVTALSVAIDPVQDLHGYDNPWPAGGGKNLLDYNVLLTWKINGNNIFSVSGNNLSVLLNNSTDHASETHFISLQAGTYTMSSSNKVRMQVSWDGTKQIDTYNTKNVTFTLPEARNDVHIRFLADSYPYNLGTVQIEFGSSATSWAPYENICPISGHTSAVVTRTGKNLYSIPLTQDLWSTNDGATRVVDGDLIRISINNASKVQGIYSHTNSTLINLLRFLRGRTITYSIDYRTTINTTIQIRIGVNAIVPNSTYQNSTTNWQRLVTTVTIPKNTSDWMPFTIYRFSTTSDPYDIEVKNLQIELNSTTSPFEPYQGQQVTIDLGGTHYGGVIDVLTGEMTVTKAIVDLGTLTWGYDTTNKFFRATIDNGVTNYGLGVIPDIITSIYKTVATKYGNTFLSAPNYIVTWSRDSSQVQIKNTDYTTAATFKTAMSGVQLVYKLATPFTVQLTPSQISTLLGQNNIWADTGDVAVEYRADTKLYIDGVASATAKVTRQMIADSATADGKAPKSLATGDLIIVGDELRKATANIGNGSAITASNSTIATLADVIKALQ